MQTLWALESDLTQKWLVLSTGTKKPAKYTYVDKQGPNNRDGVGAITEIPKRVSTELPGNTPNRRMKVGVGLVCVPICLLLRFTAIVSNARHHARRPDHLRIAVQSADQRQ